MRLRYNAKNVEKLLDSKYLLKSFPIKLTNNIIIELGMGKGDMLINYALTHPKTTYIGIEKYATVASQAAKRAEHYNLNNFFIICEDIKKIDELFEGCVDTIWLTFSDPWPKNRHEKRRLTHKSFLKKYEKILSHNGKIRLKTDNDLFFQYSLDSMKEYGMSINNISNDLSNFKKISDNMPTSYEIKWKNKNKNINYLEASFPK